MSSKRVGLLALPLIINMAAQRKQLTFNLKTLFSCPGALTLLGRGREGGKLSKYPFIHPYFTNDELSVFSVHPFCNA